MYYVAHVAAGEKEQSTWRRRKLESSLPNRCDRTDLESEICRKTEGSR